MKCPIDYTKLWNETKGYAVRCATREEAEEFIEWTRVLYPGMMDAWEPGELNYDKHGLETIYTFDYKISGEWRKHKLLFGAIKEARSLGYTIIEFADIYTPFELQESDKPMDFLFGG